MLMNHLAKASFFSKIYWKHTGQIFILKLQVEEPPGAEEGEGEYVGKRGGLEKGYWWVQSYRADWIVFGGKAVKLIWILVKLINSL